MFEYDYTLEESGVEIEEKSNKQVCNKKIKNKKSATLKKTPQRILWVKVKKKSARHSVESFVNYYACA